MRCYYLASPQASGSCTSPSPATCQRLCFLEVVAVPVPLTEAVVACLSAPPSLTLTGGVVLHSGGDKTRGRGLHPQ